MSAENQCQLRRFKLGKYQEYKSYWIQKPTYFLAKYRVNLMDGCDNLGICWEKTYDWSLPSSFDGSRLRAWADVFLDLCDFELSYFELLLVLPTVNVTIGIVICSWYCFTLSSGSYMAQITVTFCCWSVSTFEYTTKMDVLETYEHNGHVPIHHTYLIVDAMRFVPLDLDNMVFLHIEVDSPTFCVRLLIVSRWLKRVFFG